MAFGVRANSRLQKHGYIVSAISRSWKYADIAVLPICTQLTNKDCRVLLVDEIDGSSEYAFPFVYTHAMYAFSRNYVELWGDRGIYWGFHSAHTHLFFSCTHPFILSEFRWNYASILGELLAYCSGMPVAVTIAGYEFPGSPQDVGSRGRKAKEGVYRAVQLFWPIPRFKPTSLVVKALTSHMKDSRWILGLAWSL